MSYLRNSEQQLEKGRISLKYIVVFSNIFLFLLLSDLLRKRIKTPQISKLLNYTKTNIANQTIA